MELRYKKRMLEFQVPAGTSRGKLQTKPSYFLFLEHNNTIGVGECSIIPKLSIDHREDYEERLETTIKAFNSRVDLPDLTDFPSIEAGIQMAVDSLEDQRTKQTSGKAYTKHFHPIEINGLVWMGDYDFMKWQIDKLMAKKFTCIKLKIGSIDFDQEIALLEYIRKEYKRLITIRLDANGAFSPKDALSRLKKLKKYHIHSIEQPIEVGNLKVLKELCQTSPIPIALDEELIKTAPAVGKYALLNYIRPQFIVIKPSLLGGYLNALEWIGIAENLHIGWWITSALESNVGLNSIASWIGQYDLTIPQGLGTGSLFKNNLQVPLSIKNGYLRQNKRGTWQDLKSI